MFAVVIAVSLMNAKLNPEEMVARLLYRDGLMLVIDKPAGIAVHRGPKGGESLEDHFGALRFGLPRAPALAHRLDRETSGCLVLGRHRKALATLGRLFKTGAIGKCYWAVVEGGPAEDEGTIDLPLGRRDESRGWWMKPDPNGQSAVTKWKVMGRSERAAENSGGAAPQRSLPPCTGRGVTADAEFAASPLPMPPPPPGRSRPSSTGYGGREPARRVESESGPSSAETLNQHLTWLALEPVTGRTHQLRVHCAARGFPVVGDTIYGTQASSRSLRKRDPPRIGGPPLHLHAREIIVPLYKNRDPIKVMAPVPLAMQERLYACGWQGEVFHLVD
jgi:tRNA pseudouridine32 synthase/23S rRNA pseudouridine746 synthase